MYEFVIFIKNKINSQHHEFFAIVLYKISSMDRKIIITAAVFGMIAILFGAFGAHALKKVLEADQLISFETGVRYQMYHAFFLLFIGIYQGITQKTKKTIYILVLLGVLFFSGSIYLLTTRNITSIDISSFALITPVGGMLLIFAWVLLIIKVLGKK